MLSNVVVASRHTNAAGGGRQRDQGGPPAGHTQGQARGQGSLRLQGRTGRGARGPGIICFNTKLLLNSIVEVPTFVELALSIQFH